MVVDKGVSYLISNMVVYLLYIIFRNFFFASYSWHNDEVLYCILSLFHFLFLLAEISLKITVSVWVNKLLNSSQFVVVDKGFLLKWFCIMYKVPIFS
jgi:hypothetical protein